MESARKVNPVIEFTDPSPPYVVVGHADVPKEFSIFIGSQCWNAHFSSRSPQSIGQSENIIGASAAACFGAAAVFRYFFHKELGVPKPADEEYTLSLFDYRRELCNVAEAIDYDLGEIALAGIGAIGNAAVWVLSQTSCKGHLHLVDPEFVDDTNPQRYILTDAASAGSKVRLAANLWRNPRLIPVEHETTWGGFISKHPKWEMPLVAAGLDSAEDRIAVQASLPRWVLNSWTQANDLGVSRHEFNSDSACLACLYWPKKQRPNFDEEIKAAIRFSGELMEIRNMLYFQTPLDDNWLDRISRDMGRSRELLEIFKGKTLDAFYREAICGGHIIVSEGERIEVPMVFQSALAGIMLAGEIIKYGIAGQKLNSELVTTKIDLLRPLGTHLSEQYKKRTDVRCICSDPVYQRRFIEKYS
jgi:Prokaryotic E2 family C